jgi:pyruvate/2-oxoglutarate/acetoin dehydrogenase E1 component
VTKLNYRKAIGEGIARAMREDDRVVFLGEDIAAAGGTMKTSVGLLEEFGPKRVWDTPISEQAIIGAAMGAAMTGLRPIAEIMFVDFLGVCWDGIANEIAKVRYMTGGQVSLPLVVRGIGGAGMGFGAQHSQSLENWAMMIPGLKVVAPSTPADMVGLMVSAVRDPDPVVVFEHKALFSLSEDVPEDHVVPLGEAAVRHQGTDVSIIALGAMVHVALDAATTLSADGISADVLDLRCLAPLDKVAILRTAERSGRILIVEENPRACGWGGEVASILADEGFTLLDAPVVRLTPPPVPIPFAANLEKAYLPDATQVVDAVRKLL